MHTSLGHCPQLLFRYKRKKLDTLLFFFEVLANLTARLVGISFFQICVRFLFWSFLVRSVTKMSAIVVQNWFHHEKIVCGVFSRIVPRFVVVISAWPTNCQNSSIVFSLDDIKSIRCKISWMFLFVLRMWPYFLDIGFSKINWWALSMQSNFVSEIVASSSLLVLQEVTTILLITSEHQKFVFQSLFQSNQLLTIYTVYQIGCFLRANNEA